MRKACLGLAALFFATAPAFADINVVEDFSTNPLLGRWTFGKGSNANSQFTYQSDISTYLGDASGSLKVHLDSDLPSARLDMALGATVTDTHDFTLTTQFRLDNVVAEEDAFMQLGFGLVNHSLTTGERVSGTSFHMIEFDYYPNQSIFGGPTLGAAVVGGDRGTGAYNNLAFMFGTETRLDDNTGEEITALPLSINLQAKIVYQASNRTLSLEMATIDANGNLTILQTGIPVMSLDDWGYDHSVPFTVDSLAIMAHQDTAEFNSTKTLAADVTFQKMTLVSNVPEPTSTVLLLGAGLAGAGWTRWRKTRSA